MRRSRFEVTDRLEKKVWEVQQDGASLTTKLWARKGTPPRGATRQLESEAAARAEFMRLVDEREGQGYVLIESTDDTPRASGLDKEAERFEKAITSAPDKIDAYAVYGDWLVERGDALGELISVQVGLSDKPKDRALLSKQGELLDAHSDEWLGELGGEEGLDATWRWGFLNAVELGLEQSCERDPIDALRTLFRLVTSRFLRELVLGDFGEESELQHGAEINYGDVIAAMTKMPLPKTLRRLAFVPRRVKLDDAEIGEVAPLYARLPALEDLTLKGSDVVLGKIDLPELRSFMLVTRGLTRGLVRSISTARWPKLTSLIIDFGKVTGDAKLADLVPLLEAKGTPALVNVGLTGWPASDELADTILTLANGKSLQHLRSLDLSRGKLTGAGAKTLIKASKKLTHLERLDLSRQPLERATVADLRTAFGKRVVVNEGVEQGDQDDDDVDEGEERFDEVTE